MAIICVIGGVLVYQTVIDMSWRAYRESAPPPTDAAPMEPLKPHSLEKESTVAKLSPSLIVTMVIFILSLFWHVATMNGAGKILPVPATCEAYVNNGIWVPMSGCNEYDRG